MPDREVQTFSTVDKFDRIIGSLEGLPDATRTKPTTVRAVSPIIGKSQTFIIQTVRVREIGDWIFVEYVDDNGSIRIAIPPQAADAIARQRDALTSKVRRKVGREQAEARKARGELPGFMRNGKQKKAAKQ